MTKVTLDMNTFKALASDTRLNILRALDGKKMGLNDICRATNLNKATLHEHLTKLYEAGLVNKHEREGHKWVYYKLTWKGEGLLHPENTKIVVLFTTTFITLFFGIVMLVNYVKGQIIAKAVNFIGSDSTAIYVAEKKGIELFQLSAPKFENIPIANVELTNQTTNGLSQALIYNAKLNGILGNTISDTCIDWKNHGLLSNTNDLILKGEEVLQSDASSNVPQSMLAIVHDPGLQQISIVLLVIFGILLSIGIWRLWKNKKPKL
jgi:DNA-binding transcriptional ArsR family regulator